MHISSTLLVFALPLAALAQVPIPVGQYNSTVDGVPILLPRNNSAVIPNKYIVTFKSDVSQSQIDNHIQAIGTAQTARTRRGLSRAKGVKKRFGIKHYKGYSGTFDQATLKKIHQSGLVAAIEAVTPKYTQAIQNFGYYNLARISHTTIQQSPYQYLYPDSAGSGVTVYVVDTGIMISHPDFGGRAVWGANFANDGQDQDGVGHGTHCAGVVGGNYWGIAKNASLVAVKVLDMSGNGDTTTVMNGIQWVVNNRVNGTTPIITMSLGGPSSAALNDAVNNAVAAGIFIVVAAGNDNQDAGNCSPASASGALTVGAIDNNDTKASFSNYGSNVRIWAPGVNIPSDYNNGQAVYMSGTSMATPHIAGLAALIVGQSNGIVSPSAITSKLLSGASGTVQGLGAGNSTIIGYNGGEGGMSVQGSSNTTSSSTKSASSTSSSSATLSSPSSSKASTSTAPSSLSASTTAKASTSSTSSSSSSSSKASSTTTAFSTSTSSSKSATSTSFSTSTTSSSSTSMTTSSTSSTKTSSASSTTSPSSTTTARASTTAPPSLTTTTSLTTTSTTSSTSTTAPGQQQAPIRRCSFWAYIFGLCR